LLFAEKEEETVPDSASSEAFSVGLVVVVVEFEPTDVKVLPSFEGSREGSAEKREKVTRRMSFGFPSAVIELQRTHLNPQASKYCEEEIVLVRECAKKEDASF